MARRQSDDRNGATASKFYLPARTTQSSENSPFERLWATLFQHQIDS